MAAIFSGREKYECKLVNRAEHFLSSFLDKSRQEEHFNLWTHICSLPEKNALIIVPFLIRIAHIFGPQRDQDAVIYGTLHDRVVSGPQYKLYYTFIFKLYNHFTQTIRASFLFQLNL